VLEHPSVVSFVPRARGPGTSRVPEPAPLRMRSRRGLRARPELLCVLRSEKRFESSRTVFARSLRTPRASRAVACDSCGLDRASPENVFCSFSSRRDRHDAFDRLLHSETVPTRAPVSVVASQRSDRLLFCCSVDALRHRPRIALTSGVFRLRAHPRERLFSRAGAPVRRRARWAPGSSGPPGADETGEIRASRRVSHFGARPGDRVGGVFFHRARPCRSPLTLLSPPSPRRSNRFRRVGFASKAAKIDSRVCPVKSNRIPDRERLPSDSRSCAPRARRGGSVAA